MHSENRQITQTRARQFLWAVQTVLGPGALPLVWRLAGFPPLVVETAEPEAELELYASEYAALLQAIENYYGLGAPGILTRIGQLMFQRWVVGQGWRAQWQQLMGQMQAPAQRNLATLHWLAHTQALSTAPVEVLAGPPLTVRDTASDATNGRERARPICWVTLGQLQAALCWATHQTYVIRETHCRAQGHPACVFEVGAPLESKQGNK